MTRRDLPDADGSRPAGAEGAADDQSRHAGGAFGSFLRRVPVLYGIVGAAVTAVVNFFVVRRLLPEPLDRLEVLTSLLILVALLLGWIGRRRVRAHLAKVIGVTALALVLLVGLNAFLVCEVQYSIGSEPVQQNYLTGWKLADPDLQGLSCAEAIRMVGNSRDDLRVIWGATFDIALTTYTLLYLTILFGVVVSLAALDSTAESRRY